MCVCLSVDVCGWGVGGLELSMAGQVLFFLRGEFFVIGVIGLFGLMCVCVWMAGVVCTVTRISLDRFALSPPPHFTQPFSNFHFPLGVRKAYRGVLMVEDINDEAEWVVCNFFFIQLLFK